ncbi:hypothetical protein CEXT_293451 [Caerostris extrusa]|uniref:Uncharacterized protein n=1 Tax=Caerostris extrusa TaxID=172846 RepID=A0AAV4Q6L6_CAEEX|nr:hypothetical protein CEXT_293451 [Caerostris extrusa]
MPNCHPSMRRPGSFEVSLLSQYSSGFIPVVQELRNFSSTDLQLHCFVTERIFYDLLQTVVIECIISRRNTIQSGWQALYFSISLYKIVADEFVYARS